MASDLEEGEIVEEGEEVRRGNNGQGTKTSARATCRKTRKKSISGRSSGEKQKTVRNGLGEQTMKTVFWLGRKNYRTRFCDAFRCKCCSRFTPS